MKHYRARALRAAANQCRLRGHDEIKSELKFQILSRRLSEFLYIVAHVGTYLYMTSLPGRCLVTNSVNCEKLGNLGIFYGLDPMDGVMLMIGESDDDFIK